MKLDRNTLAIIGVVLAVFGWQELRFGRFEARQNERLDNIEATQSEHGERLAALEAGQTALESGQAALEAGLAGLRAALAATNESLADAEAGLRADLARTNEHVARLEGAVAVALGRLFAPLPDDADADQP